jgi:hypothetical protein
MLFELQMDYRNIVLDLKDIGVVDLDVVCFFVRCKANGVKLESCTPYIREWMEEKKVEGWHRCGGDALVAQPE